MKRHICILLLLVSSVICTYAQNARIRGNVKDAVSGTPIGYADVIVTGSDGKVVAGGIVLDGEFRIEGIKAGDFKLGIELIGYEPFETSVSLTGNRTTDLGEISLKQSAEGIEGAVFTGEKKQVVYKLDRQEINASSAVAAAGGTALDVLSTTPSVRVDADGTVTLRGSSDFLVYVDGQPSPLEGAEALQSIPAASVDDIQIITTPSARYKTDGNVGIINITTRRSKEAGLSGLLNASGSTLGSYSLDGVLNYQTGHHDFYFGGTAQEIKSRSDFNQQKTTVVDGITTRSLADGERMTNFQTSTLKAGWQFNDGKRNNLNLDFLFGRTKNSRGGDMTYIEERSGDMMQDVLKNEYDSHDRYFNRKFLFQASQNYVFTIDSKSSLTLANRFRYDRFAREYTESNMIALDGERHEGTRGYEDEHHWDCDGSLTYKLAYGDAGRFESGYQYSTYSEHGDFSFRAWDRDLKEFIWDDDAFTDFYYRRQIHSLYAMSEDKIGRFSYDAGLRADYVLDYTDISIEGSSRDIKKFNLFPSAHLSYDSGETGIFGAGYSYRATRPGIWQLEPYITYEDYYTRKIGNPDIRPQYTNSAELSWRKTFSGDFSLYAAGFFRHNRDVTDWVRRPYAPGITLDIITNAGDQTDEGLEFSGSWKPAAWWTSVLNGSIVFIDFKATSPLCTDRSSWTYQANWLNTFSLKKDTKIQLDWHFVGPQILTQGTEKAFAYADLAFRKTLAGGRLSFSAVARDVFRTARYYNVREMDGLSSITRIRPKYPNVLFSINYNFNSSKHKSAAVDSGLFDGKDF